jgi:hypothetical protein
MGSKQGHFCVRDVKARSRLVIPENSKARYGFPDLTIASVSVLADSLAVSRSLVESQTLVWTSQSKYSWLDCYDIEYQISFPNSHDPRNKGSLDCSNRLINPWPHRPSKVPHVPPCLLVIWHAAPVYQAELPRFHVVDELYNFFK